MLKPLLNRLLDIVFPPQCVSCDTLVGAYGTLCQPCWQRIGFITPPMCHACGLPFEYELGQQALCGECLHNLPPYAKARAAVRYDEHSRALVLQLKYADQTQLASVYAPWLARAGRELIEHSEVIVPVPLHYWRFIGRRYNQSALLAYALSTHCELPVLPDALQRTRATKAQAGLTRRQRQDNVRGAFNVHARHLPAIKGKHVLLVDDVMTTSATAAQCTKALLAAGALQVQVLTLARKLA